MEETKVHQLILVIVAVSLLINLLHYFGVDYQFGYNLSGAKTLRPGWGGLPNVTPTPTPVPNATITLSADKQSGTAPFTVAFTAAITNTSPITLFFGSYTDPVTKTTYTYSSAEPCIVTYGGTSCTNLTSNRTFSVSHNYNHPPGIYEAFATGTISGTSIKSNVIKIELK